MTGPVQEVFSLPEGTILLQYPATIYEEEFEDLSAWIDIVKRKISRSVIKQEPLDCSYCGFKEAR